MTATSGTGTVTISVDAELGWGWHDLDSPPPDRLHAGRSGWRQLLVLFDEFHVPATWAVVGHLLLDGCNGRHEDHPAGPQWFSREREDWQDRRDLRFADGLVDDLQEAAVDHDVGCHTFSHVPLGEPGVSTETARAELEFAARAASHRGLSMQSVVFPRNCVGHRAVLADCGFDVYRGRRPRTWAESHGLPPLLTKAAQATIPGAAPPTITPRVDEHGLVNLPASLYLFGFEGRARTIATRVGQDPIVTLARRGIDAAARTGEVFHMWLHPNNVRHASDVRRLRDILEYLSQRQADGAVTVETMAAVARRVRDVERPAEAVE